MTWIVIAVLAGGAVVAWMYHRVVLATVLGVMVVLAIPLARLGFAWALFELGGAFQSVSHLLDSISS